VKHLSDGLGVASIKKFDGLSMSPRISGPKRDDQTLVLFLDTETTGLDYTQDRVVEVGARTVLFDEDGSVADIYSGLSALQDPGRPISPNASRTNGISDDDVRGKTIDWKAVARAIDRSDAVVAHNAGFDRPFIENELTLAGVTSLPTTVWACTASQLEWKNDYEPRCPSNSLEVLCAWHGFWYDAHRALADVDALIHLVTVSQRLGELLTKAYAPSCRVDAIGTKYADNTLLKDRGYHWDPQTKSWFREVSLDEVDNERVWIRESFPSAQPRVRDIDVTKRFSRLP